MNDQGNGLEEALRYSRRPNEISKGAERFMVGMIYLLERFVSFRNNADKIFSNRRL
jgi:hypothetical protein